MRTNRKTSGNTLIIVLILMATLVALVGVSVDYTQNVGRHSSRARTNVSAQAVGEACLELAFAEWRQICRNTSPTIQTPTSIWSYTSDGPPAHYVVGTSPPPTSAFANIALPTANMFPDIPNFTATAANAQSFTVSNFKVQAIDAQFTMTTANPPVSAWPTTMEPISSTNGYVPCWPQSWYYLASADVTLPTSSGMVTTRMRRIFEKKIIRPFEYFMFFNDDLELSPISPLTIYGPVHTNAKLYTGSSNLTFNSSQPALQGQGTVAVASAGTNNTRTSGMTFNDDWIVGFKAGDTFHAGSATAPVIAANTTVTREANWQMYGWDPSQWNGSAEPTNKSGPRELIEKQVTPVSTYPDPLAVPVWDNGSRYHPNKPSSMQRYYDQAGIRIEIDSTNRVTVKDKTDRVLATGMTGPGPDTTFSSYYGYGTAHDTWKTALGASPTNNLIPVARTMTDGATTNGSAILNSASANFQPVDVGRYINGAGIREGTYIVSRASGGAATTRVTLSAAAIATATNVAITLNGTTSIQDNREGGAVELITIDFGVFKTWTPRTPAVPTGSPAATPYPCGSALRYSKPEVPNQFEIYVSALPVAGRKRALRILNGGSYVQYVADSCPAPITPDTAGYTTNQIKLYLLATDNPVYIQGDFHSGRSKAAGTDTITPACNFAGPLTTIFYTGGGTPVPGTNKILPNSRLPFWLLCDSLTVLSNNWRDSNAGLALSSRVASNTTVEIGLVTGNVPTSASNGYSGGAENIIHLMEDWTGKYFTFVGTIQQLFTSKGPGPPGQAPGKWVPPGTSGNVYKEPLRNWYWDPNAPNNSQDFDYAIAYRKHKWSPYP